MRTLCAVLAAALSCSCQPTNHSQDSQLRYATEKGDTNTIAVFLSSGGNIDALIRHSSHPVAKASMLHVAVSVGNLTAMKFLLASGADPNVVDYMGRSPAMWAVGVNANTVDRMEMLELLLRNGANPNLADRDGNTALIWASMLDTDLIANRLLKAGAQVNATNKNGFTALHLARNGSIARTLLSRGANKNLLSKTGESPSDAAIREKRFDTASTLTNASNNEH